MVLAFHPKPTPPSPELVTTLVPVPGTAKNGVAFGFTTNIARLSATCWC
ncbi:MAG: hypothetical protein R3C10_12360 [Pirellulales bacterium]